ncbi:MAG TPA: TraR/DksA family transcriptional regulator [Verrucomicrobiae bacterium]|nr:TraR/DksA family transcriptional regulator [Verrucomicrobiae bacterium]
MERKEIEQLKQKLELRREELLPSLSRLHQETRSLDVDSTQDSGDRCVISLSKESLFERSSENCRLLRLIDEALERMAEGSFGICAACGGDIPIRRLRALPWTRFCIQCQEALENESASGLSARSAVAGGALLRRAG